MNKTILSLCSLTIFAIISTFPSFSDEKDHLNVNQACNVFDQKIIHEGIFVSINDLANAIPHPHRPSPDDVCHVPKFLSHYLDVTKRNQEYSGDVDSSYHKDIPLWFRVLHHYATTEWAYWEPKIPLADSIHIYMQQYEYAKVMLDTKDGLFYSGLAIGPFIVLLNQTTSQFAVSREHLKLFLETHYKAHEPLMNQMQTQKQFMAGLKKTFDVLSDIKNILTEAAVSKKGRIT